MNRQKSGVVIVDKPAGLSSARVVAAVKRAFGAAKAGHTGTLDPFATGVMVCTVNRATRLSRFLLHGDKAYEAVLRLGAETDTQDATGTVTARCDVPALATAQIEAVFARFNGNIEQVPPAYSALKHQGVPLYKLARQGKPVRKPPRPVRIFSLTIREVALPRIRFAVTCSGGTYIRTLGADIGAALGCGGHLESLRRTRVGPFSLDRAVPLDRLEALGRAGEADGQRIAVADALPDMTTIRADESLARKIAVGRPLDGADAGIRPPEAGQGPAKVVDDAGELLAVLEPGADGQWRYCCVLSG